MTPPNPLFGEPPAGFVPPSHEVAVRGRQPKEGPGPLEEDPDRRARDRFFDALRRLRSEGSQGLDKEGPLSVVAARLRMATGAEEKKPRVSQFFDESLRIKSIRETSSQLMQKVEMTLTQRVDRWRRTTREKKRRLKEVSARLTAKAETAVDFLTDLIPSSRLTQTPLKVPI